MRLVVDWDGTATERDTLSLVMERFGDVELWRETGERMGRSLTHDAAISLSFSSVRARLADVVAWLVANVRLRPGFRELTERHRPLVVSSGFHELIEPILERDGIRVELLANRVRPHPDGWRIEFGACTACAECGEPCKRSSLPSGDVVYVGDGYSDRCAALAASRVFATGTLARYLDERHVPYERFDDFHDVLAALAAGVPGR